MARTSGDRLTLQHCIRLVRWSCALSTGVTNILQYDAPITTDRTRAQASVEWNTAWSQSSRSFIRCYEAHASAKRGWMFGYFLTFRLINILWKEQPLSASFARIVQAVGLYDHWVDVQLATPTEAEQWAQHTVQAIVWDAAGITHLFIDIWIPYAPDGRMWSACCNWGKYRNCVYWSWGWWQQSHHGHAESCLQGL